MFLPVFNRSRPGFLAAGAFLLAFLAVLSWLVLVASSNPADSGESGILLLPFTMPWVALVPDSWLGPFAGLTCILINTFTIYCVFGGVRFKRV